MDMTIRPMTKPERMYSYTQSQQIMGQTGCIGHLRGDMGSDGKGFFSSWDDHDGELKTDAFKAEFDDVVNAVRRHPQRQECAVPLLLFSAGEQFRQRPGVRFPGRHSAVCLSHAAQPQPGRV